MKNIIILGGIGAGLIAASIIDLYDDMELLGFINEFEPLDKEFGDFERKFKVIGRDKDIPDFLKREDTYVFSAFLDMKHKEASYSRLKQLGIPEDRFINLIHPTAIAPKGYCKIGHGVMLSPLSQLSPDTTVSDNCLLLPNSFLGHNSFMDEFSSLATNSVVGAHVHIGKGVHVGSNATIRETVKIGDFSFIGMGAVVLDDVPANSVVVGNPAKVLRINK